ncbi:mitochondrial ribosomal death-associated protein 3-domain-containing protein [Dipodascopsis uninucleata]
MSILSNQARVGALRSRPSGYYAQAQKWLVSSKGQLLRTEIISQFHTGQSNGAAAKKDSGSRRQTGGNNPFKARARKPKINLFAPKKSSSSSIYDFKETIKDGKLFKGSSSSVESLEIPVLSRSAPDEPNGQVLRKLSSPMLKAVNTANAVLDSQFQHLFPSHVVVTTPQTAEIQQLLKLPKARPVGENKSESCGYIVSGAAGVGKSVFLQLAIAIAARRGYFIMHIPDAKKLVDGTTDYVYNEEHDIYDQPMYTRRFLKTIRRVNGRKLKVVTLSKDYIISTSRTTTQKFEAETNTLQDILEIGISNSRTSVVALKIILEELCNNTSIPVLFTVDNVSQFAEQTLTEYRDIQNNHLKYDRLFLPKVILEYIDGSRKFGNGILLAATSSLTSSSMTSKVAFEREIPFPYMDIEKYRYDETLAENFSAALWLELKPFSKEETNALLTYFRSHNLLVDYEDKRKNFVLGTAPLVKRANEAKTNVLTTLNQQIEVERLIVGEAASIDDVSSSNVEGTTFYSAKAIEEAISTNALPPDVGYNPALVSKESEDKENDTAISSSSSSKSGDILSNVINDRAEEFWKRYLTNKYVTTQGVPRNIVQSCLLPFM